MCWGGGGEGRDIEMWNVVCLTSLMDGRSVSAGLVDLLNDSHRCIRSGVCLHVFGRLPLPFPNAGTRAYTPTELR